MSAKIDIRPDHLAIVQGILHKHLPQGISVYVFGSRAVWNARDYSDLDLALLKNKKEPTKIEKEVLLNLENDFEESDLPWKVDLVDLSAITPKFKAIIEKDKVELPLEANVKGKNDWNYLTLDEVLLISTDKVNIKEVHLEDYISTDNMLPYFGGISEAKKSPSVFKVSEYKVDDILFSNIRTYFKKVWFANKNGGCSNDVIVFRAKKDINPKFAFYSLINEGFIQYTVQTSKGTKMPRGDKEAIKKYPLSIPPLPEQKAIAHVLGSLDDKIELNRQMNQTLEAMAQALFKSWFVDFDPVIDNAIKAGNPIPETLAKKAQRRTALLAQQKQQPHTTDPDIASHFPNEFEYTKEMGWIPKGWEIKALDEIAHYQNGLALQKFRPTGLEFLPVLKISQLKKGTADGDEKSSPNIKPECIVNNGDIIFSWSGSLMVDIWCGGKAALNQHLFKVTSISYPKWFYNYFTKHHLLEFQHIAAAKAVTMGHIKREHLAQAKCTVPSEGLIKIGSIHIGNLLSKQIEQRLENTSLYKLRDTLLPKLLSGELRIPDAEPFIDEL